jgi:Flp pilus assembly protein CpaB
LNYRLRGILLLLIGVVLIGAGVGAVYLLTRQAGLLGSTTSQPAPAPEVVTNQAVVLTHDMKLGDVIKAEDITTVEIPTEYLPRDHVAEPAEAIGKYIKADLIQGEMLLQHNLADPTNKNGDLAFILSDDHILMAFSADDVMTQEAIIQRGDIIDILVTMTEPVTSENIPGVSGDTSPVSEGTTETDEKVPRSFTFDAFQNLGITALVADVITQQNQSSAAERISDTATQATPAPQDIVIRAYLLALNPQDALVLKHLKDNQAIFDFVLRSPTSTQSFEFTPVTQEYIVELYGLEILK